MHFKQCRRCRLLQETVFFSPDKTNKDGLKSYCKSCNRALTKTYRTGNPEKSEASIKRWREKNPSRQRWIGLRGSARKRGIPFELTVEELESIHATQCCAICGTAFVDKSGKLYDDQNFSVDRVDSEDPYAVWNCVAICLRDNRLKNDGTSYELRRIADFMDGFAIRE